MVERCFPEWQGRLFSWKYSDNCPHDRVIFVDAESCTDINTNHCTSANFSLKIPNPLLIISCYVIFMCLISSSTGGEIIP